MKSIINSDKVKKLVAEAVEKALEECAFQHQSNIDNPDNWCKPYRTPVGKLTLTFSFKFNNGEIWCQPVINLTDIVGD
jgi:hypothetical protein